LKNSEVQNLFFSSEEDGMVSHRNPFTTAVTVSKGFIFGAFTPTSWESRVWNRKFKAENICTKANERCKSFLFTVQNPPETSTMKFPLKANRRQFALYCGSIYGLAFEHWGWNFRIAASLTTGTQCRTGGFQRNYQVDLEVDSERFLTGLKEFNLDESEVFELHLHQ
jgi:hypothetical protein